MDNYSQWQTIRFNKLTAWLLPTFLRSSRQLIWLQLLLFPLDDLYYKVLYKMQHDGRVIYLEKVLNEWFKVEGYNPDNHKQTKKVCILDGFYPQRHYLFLQDELKPIYDDPTYLYTEEEHNAHYDDFVVSIPQTYNYNETQLRAQIDYYKLAGKTYKIKRYSL